MDVYQQQFTFPILNSTEKRITHHVSVCTAEMIGILMALHCVENVHPMDVVICSDSYSALMSINSGKSESRQDILYEVLQKSIQNIKNRSKHLIFMGCGGRG